MCVVKGKKCMWYTCALVYKQTVVIEKKSLEMVGLRRNCRLYDFFLAKPCGLQDRSSWTRAPAMEAES